MHTKSNQIKRKLLFFLFVQFALFLGAQEQNKKVVLPTTSGLMLDLDADYGVQIEDGNRINSWYNKVTVNEATVFVKQDEGRKVKGSGRPTLMMHVPKLNGHNTVLFRQQELLCHDEDVFDKLTTGSGYTWFMVMSVYQQRGGSTNAIFGNLRNTNLDKKGKYEGFWAGVLKNNTPWMGSRDGIPYDDRADDKNPRVFAPFSLEKETYYVVMGRMGSGTGTVNKELFINSTTPLDVKPYSVKINGDPSKLVLGQERNATNHPGGESFDGEIARFLIYDRPLTEKELSEMIAYLLNIYGISNVM